MNILWDADPTALERYRFAVGAETQALDSAPVVARALHDNLDVQQVIIGPDVELASACELAEAARLDRPELGVVLIRHRVDVTALTQALRSGVREVVTADDQTALVDALRRSKDLTSRLIGASGVSGGPSGHIVTVFSAKGGVGKTTLATNVACHLAMEGKKTLLIDLDLAFGDVAISLQLLPTKSIHDAVATSGYMDESAVSALVTRHEASGLDVICAPNNPGDADRIPVSCVTELLKVARQIYDYVIVDTPPSFTEHVLASCDLSDALILIATLDIPAVKNLRVAIDTLDMLGSPKEDRIVVLNRADAKVGLRPDDVVTAIKVPIAVSVPNSLTVPNSVNRGVPIVIDDAKGAVSIAIRELVDVHVRGKFGDSPQAQGSEKRKSLFRSRS